MDTALGTRVDERSGRPVGAVASDESSASAVSWAAIFAGAALAAGTSLILLSLGSGLGFASVSPWSSTNPSLTTFTILTGIWLIVVQWLASGMGGYLAGRLRTKWVDVHTDEIFFRDTAHGVLAWAVATVGVAAIVVVASASAVGTGARVAGSVAAGAAQTAASAAGSGGDTQGYLVDTLFRSPQPGQDTGIGDAKVEAARILAAGLATGDVSPADRSYLASLIAARTGIPQADAEKRVDDAIAQVKAAADKAKATADQARKAASAFSIFTALSLLIGAFIGSVAAAYGGRLRDELA